MSESTFLQVVAEKEEPNAKKSKNDEASGKEKETSKAKTKANSETPEAPKDYIHVRARRGQATDSHSLAERVCLNSMLCSVDFFFFFGMFGFGLKFLLLNLVYHRYVVRFEERKLAKG